MLRARYPDEEGVVTRDGVRVAWERSGDGDPTILFLPTWSIIHSRCWKGQIPYFARHFRAVTFDPRGNGRSDRPADVIGYDEHEFAEDALAVLDASDTESAVLVSLSRGVERALRLAAAHPERVEAMAIIAPAVPLHPAAPRAGAEEAFNQPQEAYEGWGKWNANYWRQDYRDFVEFFFEQVCSEPHSTKQLQDAIGWAMETDPESMIASQLAPRLRDEAELRTLADRVDCPAVVIHGSADMVRPAESGAALAKILGCDFIALEGSGHNPQARIPVKVNLLLRDFVLAQQAAQGEARPQAEIV